MSVESAIYSILAHNGPVAQHVGTRIRPGRANQNDSLPFLIYERISTERFPHMEGDTGLEHVRMQVSCWGATYESAKEVAEAVRSALHMYRASNVGQGGDLWDVRRIFMVGMMDVSADFIEGSEAMIRGVICEFMVWFKADIGV